MNLIWHLFRFLLFILPFLLAAAVYFCLQKQPLVKNTSPLGYTDIARAKEIIKENDPRRLRSGEKKTVSLSAEDLSLALNYILRQRLHGGVETRLLHQAIVVKATAILPANPVGNYLNVELALKQNHRNLRIEQISIGQIIIPGVLLQKLFTLYASNILNGQIQAVLDMLQSVQVDQHHLQLAYTWDTNTINQVKDLLLAKQDPQTLLAYQNHLAALSQKISYKQHHSLTELLEPLFRFATERSRDSNDAIAENRALITVLAAYIKGESLRKLTGEPEPLIRRLKLTLQNRYDFVQHFTISAGLMVTGGTSLADAMGLYKEVNDAKGSSGFSFTDLAADRAGVNFGELATQSQQSARQVQTMMSTNLREEVFMPDTSDLPESIKAAEFKRRYQNVSSPAYKKILARIDKRIDALPISQGL